MKGSIYPIFREIEDERFYQDDRWGDKLFGKKNTLNDWTVYINIYLIEAAMSQTPAEERLNLIKAAALVVAAIQQFDGSGFAPRHYDKED